MEYIRSFLFFLEKVKHKFNTHFFNTLYTLEY